MKGRARAGFSPVGGPVTPGCNGKKAAQIGQSDEEDHPALQHGSSLALAQGQDNGGGEKACRRNCAVARMEQIDFAQNDAQHGLRRVL